MYVLYDLNNDGIDELLIVRGLAWNSEASPYADDSVGISLEDAYTFYDGAAQRITINGSVPEALCFDGTFALNASWMSPTKSIYKLGANPKQMDLVCQVETTSTDGFPMQSVMTYADGSTETINGEYRPGGVFDFNGSISWTVL